MPHQEWGQLYQEYLNAMAGCLVALQGGGADTTAAASRLVSDAHGVLASRGGCCFREEPSAGLLSGHSETSQYADSLRCSSSTGCGLDMQTASFTCLPSGLVQMTSETVTAKPEAPARGVRLAKSFRVSSPGLLPGAEGPNLSVLQERLADEVNKLKLSVLLQYPNLEVAMKQRTAGAVAQVHASKVQPEASSTHQPVVASRALCSVSWTSRQPRHRWDSVGPALHVLPPASCDREGCLWMSG